MTQYSGIECDSDEEHEHESDEEYFSDEGEHRTAIDYDIDKMFEIVNKRLFNKWSMRTIHSKYTKISDGDTGRKQLSRYFFICI